MPPVFVNARELAGHLNVSYATILEWVRRGKIPHVRDGSRYLFNLGHVFATLRKTPHAPERVEVGS